MRLDPLDAFAQPRQLDAVPDNGVVVLHHSQPQFLQPGGEIVDLPAVLIGHRRQLIEAAVMRRERPRHLGQELVDRREVDAVAALHCGKNDTPKRPGCNSARYYAEGRLRASRAMNR